MKQDPKAAAGDLFGSPTPENKPPAGRSLFERMCAATGIGISTVPARSPDTVNEHMVDSMPNHRAVVDPDAGAERADAGIAATIAHADGPTTVGTLSWSEKALGFARAWVANAHPSVKFTVEDLRLDFEEAGNPMPPNNNAWGAIARGIVAAKLAVPTGEYRKAKIASSNGRAVALYRRAASEPMQCPECSVGRPGHGAGCSRAPIATLGPRS